MSGVILEDGSQWEVCGECEEYTPFNTLWYEPKSGEYPYGRDLCPKCAKTIVEKLELESFS